MLNVTHNFSISCSCQKAQEHAGAECAPACTLPYAPPEVVLAAFEGHRVAVHPSHDMWALGVMAYEALTHGRALTLQSTVRTCGLL